MAGLGLHKEIILNTPANNDQQHLNIIHLSFSSLINDRSTYLRCFNIAQNQFQSL